MKKTLFAFLIFLAYSARGNVTGTLLQNFNPNIDGQCFVTVECSQTLEPGYVNVGVFGNYATNSMAYFRNPTLPTTGKLGEPHNHLLSADFNLALGILKDWDVGVSLPFVLDQGGSTSTFLGSYNQTGLTEWKLFSKYRIMGTDTWGLAALATVSFDRIENNPFAGNDPGPTITGEVAYDYKINPDVLWGANLGYRLRDEGTQIVGTGVEPVSDQLLYSTAVAYNYHSWETTFIGELYGSLPTDDQSLPTHRQVSNLEVLVGAKKTLAERWDVQGGIGRGVYKGLATPDFRVYLGLNWRIGPLMSRAAPMPEPTPVVSQPLPPPPAEEPPDEVVTLYAINFDTNKTTMTAASQIKFRESIAQLLKKVTDLKRIVVEGHTDSVGTDARNMKLSQGRAETVRDLIKSAMHLNDDQVSAVGRGESRPIANNDTAAGRAKNRRVELKIYRNK